MADFDITTLILSEHEAFRRAFAEIESLSDPGELQARWLKLADQLEVHAAGEEEIFYPALLRKVDDSEDDTEHAIKDHNKIRSAVEKVEPHEVASDAWWDAFRAAREETVEHLEEEEHDVLPPFQDEVDEKKRVDLGMRWLKFHEDHDRARGLSGDKVDPEEYVEENAS
jgi:hypothetical protein